MSEGSAGALLREARLAQGVHIAQLAASIKVSPRKLEALEADRLDELIDPAFARALAKAVCRALKIDADPVLARMPQPPAQRLEHASRGLDTPFRSDGARRVPGESSLLLRPVVWGPVLIVLAAFGLLLLPPDLLREFSASISGPAPAASTVAVPLFPPAASVPGAAASVAPSPDPMPAVAQEAAPASAAALSPPPPPEPESLVVITARTDSWIEIVDSGSRSLISRTVHAGETVRLDGTPPLRVRVGNVAGTELTFRGQAIDLVSMTRGNIARFDLK